MLRACFQYAHIVHTMLTVFAPTLQEDAGLFNIGLLLNDNRVKASKVPRTAGTVPT